MLKQHILYNALSTMAQMAHFSYSKYFTILNSEICTTNFGIRNCEVYVMLASANRKSTLEGILNLQIKTKGSMTLIDRLVNGLIYSSSELI